MNESIKQNILENAQKHKVVVYMRGTPEQPRCGFSARVVNTLKKLDVPFYSEDMDSVPDLWQTLAEINQWRTSPQIYVNGEFIGGCDILVEMARNGELQQMLGIEGKAL